MTFEEALIQIFKDNPKKNLEIQDLYNRIEDYCKLTDFQKENDPKYSRPRYHHIIRSIVAKLKKKKIIIRVGYDQYRLKGVV